MLVPSRKWRSLIAQVSAIQGVDLSHRDWSGEDVRFARSWLAKKVTDRHAASLAKCAMTRRAMVVSKKKHPEHAFPKRVYQLWHLARHERLVESEYPTHGRLP